jgi:hypothetical protein
MGRHFRPAPLHKQNEMIISKRSSKRNFYNADITMVRREGVNPQQTWRMDAPVGH